MKKRLAVSITALLLAVMIIPQTALGAFNGERLTWDGKSVTLKELSRKTGYDFAGSNGAYVPLYADSAEYLRTLGLLEDLGGAFNLDEPVTWAEGVVLILRLMGGEQAALDAKLTGDFADVPDWARYQVAYAAQKGILAEDSHNTFDAGAAMSADQYISLVLRALGYMEGEDFAQGKAADKALEIGLIGAPCREQYTHSNLFLRDNAAVIACNALQTETKSGLTLTDKISAEAAERHEDTASTNGPANLAISLTSGGVGRITMEYVPSGQGGVAGAVGYTTMQVGDYSGSLDIVYTVNGVSKTHTVTVEKNTTYTLTYTYPAAANNDTSIYQPGQKIMTGIDPITKLPKYIEMPGKTTSIPGAVVSNIITISAGGSVCRETVSIKGTLSTGSLSINKR